MDRVKGVGMSDAGWITKLVYRALKKRIGLVPKSKALAAYNTGTLRTGRLLPVVRG